MPLLRHRTMETKPVQFILAQELTLIQRNIEHTPGAWGNVTGTRSAGAPTRRIITRLEVPESAIKE